MRLQQLLRPHSKQAEEKVSDPEPLTVLSLAQARPELGAGDVQWGHVFREIYTLHNPGNLHRPHVDGAALVHRGMECAGRGPPYRRPRALAVPACRWRAAHDISLRSARTTK